MAVIDEADRDTLAKLGMAVVAARQAAGLSQAELSEEVGLTRSYVSGIETGIRNPTMAVIVRICRTLNTTPSLLMKGIQ